MRYVRLALLGLLVLLVIPASASAMFWYQGTATLTWDKSVIATGLQGQPLQSESGRIAARPEFHPHFTKKGSVPGLYGGSAPPTYLELTYTGGSDSLEECPAASSIAPPWHIDGKPGGALTLYEPYQNLKHEWTWSYSWEVDFTSEIEDSRWHYWWEAGNWVAHCVRNDGSLDNIPLTSHRPVMSADGSAYTAKCFPPSIISGTFISGNKRLSFQFNRRGDPSKDSTVKRCRTRPPPLELKELVPSLRARLTSLYQRMNRAGALYQFYRVANKHAVDFDVQFPPKYQPNPNKLMKIARAVGLRVSTVAGHSRFSR